MIRAAAIVYALFIILILSIIVSTYLLFIFYSNQLNVSSVNRINESSYLNSGISLLLSDYRNKEYYEEQKILFPYDTLSKVYLKKIPWGVFEVISAIIKNKNSEKSRTYLVGDRTVEMSTTAMYLVDNQQPLSISGKTILNGNLHLPKSGLRKAYVEGKTFRGLKKNEGEILNSTSSRLKLLNEKVLSIKSSLDRTYQFQVDSAIFINNLDQDTLNQGFNKSTIVLRSNSTITLESINLEGNIIVKSDSSIFIKNTATLSNILVFGEKVIVENGFEGNIQIFALDTIIIGQNSRLQYPSVVATFTNSIKNTQLIKIEESSQIEGVVIQHNGNEDPRNKIQLIVEEESQIVGQIFSEGTVKLSGVIRGSVCCNKFFLKTNTSIYENYLLDTEVNSSKLNSHYIGAHCNSNFTFSHKGIIDDL